MSGEVNIGSHWAAKSIDTAELYAYSGLEQFRFTGVEGGNMKKNVFSTIGGGNEAFTTEGVKRFDDACHFTRQIISF